MVGSGLSHRMYIFMLIVSFSSYFFLQAYSKEEIPEETK